MDSHSIKDRIHVIWYHVVSMLQKRGFDTDQINTRIPLDLLHVQYDRLMREGTKGQENAMDIIIRGPRKCYVKFLSETLYKKDRNDYAGMRFWCRYITQAHYLSQDDDIIFVLLTDDVDPEKCYEIEGEDERVSVFPYKKLLFDITEHVLVPPHRRVEPSARKVLKRQLSISQWTQLPALEASDAICRYYRFRRGDVIEISRATDTGPHVAYRVVI